MNILLKLPVKYHLCEFESVYSWTNMHLPMSASQLTHLIYFSCKLDVEQALHVS